MLVAMANANIFNLQAFTNSLLSLLNCVLIFLCVGSFFFVKHHGQLLWLPSGRKQWPWVACNY